MGTATILGRRSSVEVNGQPIVAEPRENLLQAALRNGIDFPHSCRVGACGTCKCRLTEGKVRELTETGYLLTAEEIEQGYILACQSVPLTDVKVEVDATTETKRVAGQVVGQKKLTHDIVQLTIQLDTPLSYRAGQFALFSVEGLEGVSRSYSFANPPDATGRVEFFIRKVPGGALSTLVNEASIIGRQVVLEGPNGQFWLRPSTEPMLLVAGGSGLAPVLALLEDAANKGVARNATLLFGAREEKDLYALERIEKIARQWNGHFEFVPILSAEPAGTAWRGARGFVTDHLPQYLSRGSHAYLCGPPAMIDRAIELLEEQGVDPDHIHFDRFSTQGDSVRPKNLPVATTWVERATQFFHYAKYFLFHLVGLFSAVAILAGGHYITIGLVAILVLYMLGDALSGDDTTTPRFRHPSILTIQLWMALPLLSLIVFISVWSVCSNDPLGFGHAVYQLTGYDILAARAGTTWGHHVSTFIITGLMIGLVGTITGHELTHRTWDPISLMIGRWLLAFSFDTTFSIEHVYGHHRYVSTRLDPATAPRGRNVYFHILASTINGNISAWHIEVERLRKKKRPVWSWHNAMIRGHLMSAALVAIAYLMGGWTAALFFCACALWGKSLLEIVNYMEHYGMVRNPETPVQPRHSWNTNRRISSWTMFNLTRHSHHHAHGEVPYHELKPFPNAPMMINGYLTTIVVALIPPLWHALMTPKVLAWDRDFATAEEKELARQANARSGIRTLAQAARLP